MSKSMIYEAWRITYQSSEAAARAAYNTVEKMHAENTALNAEIELLRARVQELGEIARENRSKRVIELEQRIAEMGEQMAAIGAGGVEPLRKRAASAALAAHDERQAFEKWLRIKPCGAAHDFGWEAWKARAALAAQAKQGERP